jgi:hypothetical protein
MLKTMQTEIPLSMDLGFKLNFNPSENFEGFFYEDELVL